MRRSNHAFALAVGLLSAAIVGSCGGKVEVSEGAAAAAGTGGTGVGTGGAGGSGKGGTAGTGWSGSGGTGGSSWGGSGGTKDSGSPYGLMTEIKFSTPFLLDSEKSNDNNYVQQHDNAFLYNAAFFGYYGLTSKPIPPVGGQDLAWGEHVSGSGGHPPAVSISQYSLLNNNDALNPAMQLHFASDEIKPGPLQVGMSAAAGASLLLFNSLEQGQGYCAIAVGYGSLQITQAENTTAQDGGKLSLYGANLLLYYPTDTPDGDVSPMIKSPICPKE